MKFRYKLGQTLGDDIITDGDFPDGTAGWTFNGNWSLPVGGGEANHVGATYDYLEQDCGFVSGVRYKITFTVSDIPGGGADYLQVYISGFSITTNPNNNFYQNSNGTYVVYGTCLSATDSKIRFLGYGTVSVTDITAEPYEWNDPLDYEPDNWENTNIALQKSELLDYMFVKYIEGLTFIKDGYDYLLAEYNALAAFIPKEFCEKIPILIERWISGAWETHFEGIIYLSDCKFDLKRKQVTCNIEDVVASQAIRMNKDKTIGISYHNRNVFEVGVNKFDYPSEVTAVFKIDGSTVNRYVYILYKVLRQIVHEITDLAVTFESDLLNDANYEGVANVFQLMGITPFKNFSTDIGTYTCFGSLYSLLSDFNVIRNIALLADYTDDVPKLKMESKASLTGTDYTFTVDNNAAEFSFYDENNYHSIDFGYIRPDETDLDNIDAAGFVLKNNWDRREWRSNLLCNDKQVTLLSETGAQAQWIYNQLINPEFDPTVPSGFKATFTPRNFWLQLEFSGGIYQSRTFILDATDYYNNPDIENEDCFARWVNTLNGSFISSDEAGSYESNKTNDPIVRVWEFETIVDLNDLDEIAANPYYRVPMTSEHFTGTIYGYILDFKYSNKANYNGGSMATFKIIST